MIEVGDTVTIPPELQRYTVTMIIPASRSGEGRCLYFPARAVVAHTLNRGTLEQFSVYLDALSLCEPLGDTHGEAAPGA